VLRRLLTAAVAVPMLVVLAACSSGPSGASGSSSGGSSPAGTALPTVTGAVGAAPVVTLPHSNPPSGLKTEVLHQGNGPTVAKGDVVAVNYLGEIWKSAKVFDSSFASGRNPVAFPVGTGQLIPGFDTAMLGQKVGSRVLAVVPPDQAYGANGNSQVGIAANDTLVFVVDVLGAQPPGASANGRVAPKAAASLPTVSTRPGKPTITIPHTAAPTKLVVSPVLQGTGPVVQKGDLVIVEYVGEKWADGKTFDSSWTRGAPAGFPIGVGQVVKGWDVGLVGRHVGDRVLLVVPPADGYGASGQPSAGIKGTDTLVFAVDVLGTYH